jgi:glycosyltransferase involved in cell wall biosynthesis
MTGIRFSLRASASCWHRDMRRDSGSLSPRPASAGSPVLRRAVVALWKIVIENETGILVDKHSPDALAKVMLRLSEDTRLRQAMGARARVVKQFSILRKSIKPPRFFNGLASEVQGLEDQTILPGWGR